MSYTMVFVGCRHEPAKSVRPVNGNTRSVCVRYTLLIHKGEADIWGSHLNVFTVAPATSAPCIVSCSVLLKILNLFFSSVCLTGRMWSAALRASLVKTCQALCMRWSAG